jgi:hypothetical protein
LQLTSYFAQIGWAKVTESANTNRLLWPAQVIEQATGILMNRFELDARQALKLLRKLSQRERMQMCVIAEQVINHGRQADSAEAAWILGVAARDFPELDEPGDATKRPGGHPN